MPIVWWCWCSPCGGGGGGGAARMVVLLRPVLLWWVWPVVVAVVWASRGAAHRVPPHRMRNPESIHPIEPLLLATRVEGERVQLLRLQLILRSPRRALLLEGVAQPSPGATEPR
eukprot:1668094-Prymnesium_polylepis.1